MGNYTQLYLHCVWATWERRPLVSSAVENEVYACIAGKCREKGCEPLAIGGVEDHVHLLVRFRTSTNLAKLVGEAKGASSFLMTSKLARDSFFKWQSGYGVFTVSKEGIPALTSYIKSQKLHHANGTLKHDWEHWDTQEGD